MISLRPLVSLGLTTLLLSGCGTGGRDARIQEQATLFASLDGNSQKLIRAGLVDMGFTLDMVRMSLGQPDAIESRDTSQGRTTVWIYRHFVYDAQMAMQLTTANPGGRSGGPINSSSSPDGPSLLSTKNTGARASVSDAGDAPVGRLTLEFIDGKVGAVRLDP
jgi:hypothetical protein